MLRQRKRLLLTLLTATIIVSAVSASAFLTSAPAQLQIAKNATAGLYNCNPNLIWEKTFGGPGDDRAYYAATVNDGYIVVGSSTSFEPGKTVASIVRLDKDGNQLWNRTYSENMGAEFRYISGAQDGFVLVGNTFLPSGDINGLVMKIDNQGNPDWNVTLNAAEGVNKLFSAVKDGNNFVVSGLTQPQGSNGTSQAWFVKLEPDGNVLWNKTYGNSTNSAARAITLTPDNGYLAAGYTNVDGNGNYDFLALKLDSSGNLLWNKTYGGPQSDMAYTVTSANNGYVIAGNTYSYGAGDSDAWIIKINLNGDLLWNTTVGGKNYDSPAYITQSQDGAYLVAGTTFSFGNGNRDFWLFKIDDSGRVLWSCTVGRSGYEESYAVLPVGGDNYVMAGWTNSIGSGGYDFYIVKINVEPNEP